MDQFQHFAESRKRQALSDWKAYQERLKEKNARRQAGGDEETEIDTTLHLTAYVLDAMVNDSKKHALNWEKREKLKPVDVPLFAKVLQDRTEAELLAGIRLQRQSRILLPTNFLSLTHSKKQSRILWQW